jgi:hypothetical protein
MVASKHEQVIIFMEARVMIRKLFFALCVATVAGQVAMAQTSSGNILLGDAKAEVVRRYGGPETLPRPERVLIHDFVVPVNSVSTDESIAGRLHRDMMLRHGVDEDSTPETLARRVQTAFTKTLTEELKKVNMPVAGPLSQKALMTDGVFAGSELVIDGEFVAIHEGDETKRIMIGFGRGASDIKTHVTVSAVVQSHPMVILELNLSSESGKKPGAVATIGVGSLAVGAVAGGVGDRKSKVETDASRMATLVAKQLDAFMTDQKWISNPVGVSTKGHQQPATAADLR